jgi:hypothetical protein
MSLRKLFAGVVAGGSITMLAVGGCSAPGARPGDQERVGVAEEPIDPASCDKYLKPPFARTCRTKAPDPKECAFKGMPDGQGWDQCKWKPRPASATNCVDPKDCPPPPKNADDKPCVQGIFGRFADTKKYYGCPGYMVINLPSDAKDPDHWTLDRNDLYEDCILYGMFENSCENPMIFVSKTDDIPDYDPFDPTKPPPPGQITSQEFCRARICHECKTIGRKDGGYILKECENFKPKPKPDAGTSPGKPKGKGMRTTTSAIDPTKTCSVPEYGCDACTVCGGAPGYVAEETGGGGQGGHGGGSLTALPQVLLAASADQIGYGGQGGHGGVGGQGGQGGAGGQGGQGGADAGVCSNFDDDYAMCGGCDAAGLPQANGYCEVGETGPDCECDPDALAP